MAKLRSELAAYLFGSKREDRGTSHRPGPTAASQAKEGRRGPSLPEKEIPPRDPEKSPCPEREAAASLPLPPADYTPRDSPVLSVQQIRSELEARLSASAEKEPKPSTGALPPKPRLEGGRVFENRAANGQFPKPVAKNMPPLSTAAQPTAPLQSKAEPGPATPPKSTPVAAASGPATPSTATALPATPFPTTEKKLVPAEQRKKPEPQEFAAPSQPEAEGRPSEARKPPAQGALSPPALPPKVSPGRGEVTCLYKPHRSQNSSQSSPSREVAVVMPTLARGAAAGSGEAVEVGEPQGLPDKAPAPAQPADEPLRHPVTGEVVERGSPMALLLAARQRAQKGRSRGAGLGRTSLPGSLRGQPQAGSDSIFLREGQPNSFTVVPRPPTEPEKDPQPPASAQPRPWKAQLGRDPEDTEPSRGHSWTKAEPQAPVAWERSASSNLPQGRPLPKSFSSPSSPSCKGEEEEFSFEVIPPPPEFSNDPEPRALQYLGRRASPPRNRFSDSGRPLDARYPAGELYSGAGGLQRFSGGGRSLIKKRLYVGEPHRSPAPSRGGSGRSLSSPNCFGPQPGGPFGAPGGPEMRRVNSAGRAPPGGLRARRMSLEGSARGEAKYKAAGPAPSSGDLVLASAAGRSPRSTPHYGSPINTFTVRPGTRHPISYAYSGAHRNALS